MENYNIKLFGFIKSFDIPLFSIDEPRSKAKYMIKTIAHDPRRTWAVLETARLYKVSTRYVYMVINGDRVNDDIFASYMDILQGSNKLLEEVKKLVPFTNDKNPAA